MFDYKRFSYLLIVLVILLITTDSHLEKSARKSLLSFFDVVVEEGSDVGQTAPSSFVDTVENIRINSYKYLSEESRAIDAKYQSQKGALNIAYGVIYYILEIFTFICSYVILFYPLLIFFAYIIISSLIGRKNDFDDF